MKTPDVIGSKFGMLTAEVELPKAGRRRVFRCACDCGKTKTALLENLRSGKTTSCGCAQKEAARTANKTHGMTGTREFISWMNMKARCLNPASDDYENYGGRGIAICQGWLQSFEAFLNDLGECPDGMTLDRIEVNGNYEPGNCRWATPKTQANNTRANRIVEVGGRQLTLAQACETLGLNYKTVHRRLARGWTISKALS